MILLRLIVRLLGVIWVLALALGALAIAAYCLDGAINLGTLRPDHLLGLPAVHHRVGSFLNRVSRPGPTALLALLAGLVSVLLGAIILIGVVRRPKERLVVLDADQDGGTIAARRGTLREMIRVLALQAHQATAVERPRLSLSRRGNRGAVRILAKRSASSQSADVAQAIKAATAPLTEPFSLKQRVRVVLGGSGERVR